MNSLFDHVLYGVETDRGWLLVERLMMGTHGPYSREPVYSIRVPGGRGIFCFEKEGKEIDIENVERGTKVLSIHGNNDRRRRFGEIVGSKVIQFKDIGP